LTSGARERVGEKKLQRRRTDKKLMADVFEKAQKLRERLVIGPVQRASKKQRVTQSNECHKSKDNNCNELPTSKERDKE